MDVCSYLFSVCIAVDIALVVGSMSGIVAMVPSRTSSRPQNSKMDVVITSDTITTSNYSFILPNSVLCSHDSILTMPSVGQKETLIFTVTVVPETAEGF